MKSHFRWIHSTVLAAMFTGLTLASAGAFALDIARVPPRTLKGLEFNLHIAATDRAELRFQQILRPYLADEEPSGLIVIGAAEDHEVESARHFARLLKQKMGLRVVLLSTWGMSQMPGYDGVIIDKDNRPVANFSMKKLFASSSLDSVLRITRHAFMKIRRFSSLTGWLAVLTNQMHYSQVDGAFEITKPHQAEVLYRVYHELADMISILSVGEGRPDWVFVDTGARSEFTVGDAVEFVRDLPLTAPHHEGHAVIVRARKDFFTFANGRFVSQRASPCEDVLSTTLH